MPFPKSLVQFSVTGALITGDRMAALLHIPPQITKQKIQNEADNESGGMGRNKKRSTQIERWIKFFSVRGARRNNSFIGKQHNVPAESRAHVQHSGRSRRKAANAEK